MDQHIDWERLARYVTDQCSPDEAAEVERWIALDPARRQAVRDMRAIWANAQVAPTGWDVARAWRESSRTRSRRAGRVATVLNHRSRVATSTGLRMP